MRFLRVLQDMPIPNQVDRVIDVSSLRCSWLQILRGSAIPVHGGL
jgi:hypothetical protein